MQQSNTLTESAIETFKAIGYTPITAKQLHEEMESSGSSYKLATVKAALKQLKAQGLVAPVGTFHPGGRGRPAVTYSRVNGATLPKKQDGVNPDVTPVDDTPQESPGHLPGPA